MTNNPIKPPILRTINGIGLRMLGARDTKEDGTYLSNLCFTFFFVPVFFICSYRVENAVEGEWYFYSKEPLGKKFKYYNYFATPLVIAFWVGLIWYVNSPKH